MGCGKSTIGRELSKRLQVKFIDLDSVLEIRNNRTVTEIFSDSGESAFRDLESQTLHLLTPIASTVISLGGGTPCFNDNMTYIADAGISFYLEVPAEKLAGRLYKEKDHRPLIKESKSIEELSSFISKKLAYREKYYKQATYSIEADKNIDVIVEKIIFLLNS